MTPQERAFAVEQLQECRRRLETVVSELTSHQWQFRPAEADWSPAECVEHLALMEDLVYGLIQRALETPAEPSQRALTEGKDEFVLRAVPDRRRKVKAPESLQPGGRWEPQEALQQFRERRERTIRFAESTGVNLRNHVFTHPFLRELDAYQWILILAVHTERHTRQIEEVRQSPAFPA